VPLIEVSLNFGIAKAHTPLHDALLALRAVTVEAPTTEVGEHYGNEIMKALERESDR
jgi:hypothetical protein